MKKSSRKAAFLMQGKGRQNANGANSPVGAAALGGPPPKANRANHP